MIDTRHEIAGALLAAPTRNRADLTNRVLTLTSDPWKQGVLGEIDVEHGGVVLTGKSGLQSAAYLRRQRPDLTILIEPTSAGTYVATAEAPLAPLESAGLLEGLMDNSHDDLLRRQLEAGADFAITPSGQIGAQDSPALKALIARSNQLPGRVLLLVVVHPSWFSPQWVRTLIAILKTSNHPILLGSFKSDGDPLSGKGAIAGYRQVGQEVDQVFAWRSDVSGLGGIAYGMIGAGIGTLASQRRFAVVGKRSSAFNPKDRSPSILVPQLLRYRKSQAMHEDWFAGHEPLTCTCHVCNGRGLDRFDETAASVAEGLSHNSAVLRLLAADLIATSSVERRALWADWLRAAQEQHVIVGQRIGLELTPPPYIKRWLS